MIILGFNGSWNDYMMPTVFTLTNPEQRTLIVGITALKSSSGAASQWNLMLAGSAIALVPVLVMYACCNRYFVSGLSAGAVKTLAAKGISGFDRMLKAAILKAPLKRNVSLEDVGKTGLYLVSDLASGVTGEIVHVDCGCHSVYASIDEMEATYSYQKEHQA